MKILKIKLIALTLSITSVSANAQNSNLLSESQYSSGSIANSTTPKLGATDLFSLTDLKKINSKESDFGGYPIGDHIIYCSASNVLGPIKRLDNKTKKPLYNLYKGNVKENELTSVMPMERLKKIHAGPVCITPDSKYIFITSDHATSSNASGVKKLEIYRAQVLDNYTVVDLEPLPLNSVDYSVGHPAVSKDGKTLYFASDMPGGKGGVDLYKLPLNTDGTYGAYENLGSEINTSGNDYFPWIGEDGMLFFSSDGHGGFGGLDVFVAYPGNSGWNNLTNLGASLNSSSDEFAFILMEDGMSGYVSSNRIDGKGDDDIYAFKLLSSLKQSYQIAGIAIEKISSEPIEGLETTLLDKDGNIVATTLTDKNGKYSFDVEESQDYIVQSKKEGYFESNKPLNTDGLISGQPKLVSLEVEKDPGLALFGLVTDGATKKPIQGVKLSILDNLTGLPVGEFSTDANGNMLHPIGDKRIGDRVSYNIEISKDGYLSSRQTFNTLIEQEGKLNLHEQLNFELVTMEEGSDLGKLIDLKPIYFDLGKYAIRQDASIELDKIVKIMNDNPKMKIELGAHTDSRGSASSNMRLSDKRAKSSAKYIQDRISNPSRINGKGFGETALLNKCADGVKCLEAEHSVNRRTEFKIVVK
jgi:outer membrane protein OmpA-like peptidoglycan-associated protein/Tol biopolymer transport system component